MEISIVSQLWATLYSLAVGAFLALSYDVVRISRVIAGLRESTSSRYMDRSLPIIGCPIKERSPRTRIFADVFVFVGDIAYFAFASFVFLVFVFHANNGNGRWFLIAGCFAGFVLYMISVGRAVMLVSGVIHFVISAIWAYVVWFGSLPVRLLFGYVLRPIGRFALKKYAKFRTDLYEKDLKRELEFS